jgi:prepilin-type N-terminal cleavage/methylation domain-containing protein
VTRQHRRALLLRRMITLRSAHLAQRGVTCPPDMEFQSGKEHSQGFTLVELLIVMTIMPLIIGALAVCLFAVLSLQPKVSVGLSDSSNAQVVSANFEKDVLSATDITIAPSPQCGSGTQLLGLQNSLTLSVISYNAASTPTGYTIERQQCTSGNLTPVSSTLIGSDMAASPSSPTLTCSASVSSCTVSPTTWESTAGVTSVTLGISVHTGASYTLAATPVLWNATNGASPGPGSPLFPFIGLCQSSGCQTLKITGEAALNVGSLAQPGPIEINSPFDNSVQLSDPEVLSVSEIVTADSALKSYVSRRGSGPTEIYQSNLTDPFATMVAPNTPAVGGSGQCVDSHDHNAINCSAGEYRSSQSFDNGTYNFAAGTYVFDQPVDITSNVTVNFGAGNYWFKGGLAIDSSRSEGDGDGSPAVNFGAGTYILGDSTTNNCPISDGKPTCFDIGPGATTATSSSSGALFYVEAGEAILASAASTTLIGSTAFNGVAIWDAVGSNYPLTITSSRDAPSTFGGIYVPQGETDFEGSGSVTATFVASGTTNISDSQVNVG